jgi:hypothetical protein
MTGKLMAVDRQLTGERLDRREIMSDDRMITGTDYGAK